MWAPKNVFSLNTISEKKRMFVNLYLFAADLTKNRRHICHTYLCIVSCKKYHLFGNKKDFSKKTNVLALSGF